MLNPFIWLFKFLPEPRKRRLNIRQIYLMRRIADNWINRSLKMMPRLNRKTYNCSQNKRLMMKLLL